MVACWLHKQEVWGSNPSSAHFFCCLMFQNLTKYLVTGRSAVPFPILLICLLLYHYNYFCYNSISVPPTAVWISKKDQHLISNEEAVFNCASTGASPRSKFSWFLGDKLINGNEVPLHQVRK